MDLLTLVGVAIVAFIMLLAVLFLIGLKSKVPTIINDTEPYTIDFETWKPDVPEQIVRHFELVYGYREMPKVQSAVVKGKAKYKISNLWMPVLYQTSLEHGRGFLRDLEFYWYGKVIMKGIDFWINHVGALKVNGIVQMSEMGVNVTESQWISFWAESLLIGVFDFRNERIKWQVVDEKQVDLYLPPYDDAKSDQHMLQIFIDGNTGKISRIQGERYRGQLGKERVKWMIRVKKWSKVSNLWVPDYEIQWLDQKKPWCRLEVTGLHIKSGEDSEIRESLKSVPIIKYRGTHVPVRRKKQQK